MLRCALLRPTRRGLGSAVCEYFEAVGIALSFGIAGLRRHVAFRPAASLKGSFREDRKKLVRTITAGKAQVVVWAFRDFNWGTAELANVSRTDDLVVGMAVSLSCLPMDPPGKPRSTPELPQRTH